MVKVVQQMGHDTADANAYTGPIRQITIDTDKNTIRVHDGATPGGHEAARADLTNAAEATTAVAGKVMLASNAEAIAGASTSKVLTPAAANAAYGSSSATSYNLDLGNAVMSASEAKSDVLFGTGSNGGAAVEITIPNGVSKIFYVRNNNTKATCGMRLRHTVGTTMVTVLAGDGAMVWCDGTANVTAIMPGSLGIMRADFSNNTAELPIAKLANLGGGAMIRGNVSSGAAEAFARGADNDILRIDGETPTWEAMPLLGKIGQVSFAQLTARQNVYVTGGPKDVPIDNLTIAITPQSAGSRFALFGNVYAGRGQWGGFAFRRNGSKIGLPGAYSNNTLVGGFAYNPIADLHSIVGVPMMYVDSPNTLAEITYDVAAVIRSGLTGYWSINYGDTSDLGGVDYYRTISSLIVAEILP